MGDFPESPPIESPTARQQPESDGVPLHPLKPALLRTRARPGDLPGVSHGFGLPPDMMARARDRLGRFLLLMAIVFAAVTVLLELPLVDWGIKPRDLNIIRVCQFVAIAAHLGLYSLTRWGRLSHSLMLNLGLAYEIALCLAISIGDTWLTYRLNETIPQMTFASLVIAVYPLIIPSPPGRTLTVGLAAAAMAPLGILILQHLGLISRQPADFVVASIMPLISVSIAVLGSRLVHGLNIDLARGRQLGSYQLESRLGLGGMGEVWRASHQMLARQAAIKLVRPEALGGSRESRDTLLARFEREAQATASMQSPHTIQLYDYGISDAGTFYYVMELLSGLDLDSFVKRFGPLPAGRVVYLLRQVCQSLAEAHQHGLIHRDVKPANLYLCRYGLEVDFIKVLDFGLVKTRHPGDEQDTRLTGKLAAAGTPAFMAPEQVVGNRPVDARSDIYAVGCVAYWLLTGQLVFQGKTAMEIMTHHARTPAEPPSHRTDLPIPEALAAIVLSCLEKEPESRPSSTETLLEAFDGCLIPEPWTASQARQWWDVHLPLTGSGRVTAL